MKPLDAKVHPMPLPGAPLPTSKTACCAGSRGFSLIELMVALVIAGVLLLGMSVYFVNSSRNFSETERISRQIENGRYAASVISAEARHAGFYGEVGNVVNLPVTAAIAMPGSVPDYCLTALDDVKAALPLPIQGDDAPASAPSCLPDHVADTDVLVVRRANTTTQTAGSAVATSYYTQTAFCATANPVFKVAQSGFNLKAKDCATDQPVRQLHTYIFYVAKCSIGTNSDGTCKSTDPLLPTLKRAEPSSDGTFTYTPLVEGIEDLQVEYGRDTTGDGSPDTFTASPANVAQWAQIVALRLHLLARNTEPSASFTDTKTYRMGLNADGSANNVTPGGSFRRHAYTELIRVQNVSQRIEAVFP
jgi:type IV pilus assembly protein PilW